MLSTLRDAEKLGYMYRGKNSQDGEQGVETPFLLHLKYNAELCIGSEGPRMIWLAPRYLQPCLMPLFLSHCVLVTHWPSFSFPVYTKSFLVSGSWRMTTPATCWAPLPRLYLGTPLFSVVCLNVFSSDNLLPLTWDTLVMISNCALYVYFIDVYHSLNVCVWMKLFA